MHDAVVLGSGDHRRHESQDESDEKSSGERLLDLRLTDESKEGYVYDRCKD